jgi:hypothetical protein
VGLRRHLIQKSTLAPDSEPKRQGGRRRAQSRRYHVKRLNEQSRLRSDFDEMAGANDFKRLEW